MQDLNITERGNSAFRNEEGAAVLFTRLEEGVYLQAAFTPSNYPAWNVSTIEISEETLIDHITNNLGSWVVDSCNIGDLNIKNGFVADMDTITEDVSCNVNTMADKYGFDPNGTDLLIREAIRDSAKLLGYHLTNHMVEKCVERYDEDF